MLWAGLNRLVSYLIKTWSWEIRKNNGIKATPHSLFQTIFSWQSDYFANLFAKGGKLMTFLGNRDYQDYRADWKYGLLIKRQADFSKSRKLTSRAEQTFQGLNGFCAVPVSGEACQTEPIADSSVRLWLLACTWRSEHVSRKIKRRRRRRLTLESYFCARDQGNRNHSWRCSSETPSKMPFQNSSSRKKHKLIITGVMVLLVVLVLIVVVVALKSDRKETPKAEVLRWKGKGTTAHLHEIILGRCYVYVMTVKPELGWVLRIFLWGIKAGCGGGGGVVAICTARL